MLFRSAFAGYEGMVTMIAEIDKALFNPMWREVRSVPPWERGDALLADGADAVNPLAEKAKAELQAA